MPDGEWQIASGVPANDDAALGNLVLESYRRIYVEQLSREQTTNPTMGFEIRSMRRVDDWRVMLLLTPWMLGRLFFPIVGPRLNLPSGWRANERTAAAYQVLGPRLSLEILGQTQCAHLCFEPGLGHHLLQPIALSMLGYGSPDEVFEHWGQVIRTRDENMEKTRRDCPWQKAISRRELFSGRLPPDRKT